MDENKKYALFQHEVLHAWLRHVTRHRDSTKGDAQPAEYVANGIIEEINKGLDGFMYNEDKEAKR